MENTIDIALRVQYNTDTPTASSILVTASADGVSMQPVFASGKLNHVGELINQLIDDTLIQARVAREQLAVQSKSCEAAGCEPELPADGEPASLPPTENKTAPANRSPLTLLNFG